MKIFLAGTDLLRPYPDELKKSKYQLASFYNIQDWMMPFLNHCSEWLLDSGAFSFMNGAKSVDFDSYLNRYIEFINKYNVKLFFELDLDAVVGYKKTLEYRDQLEAHTGKKCIPVWHKSRGIKEFQKMCDEYSYAAIGGIVSGEIKKEQYGIFPAMISEAHKRGCKLHGLGFTNLEWLPRCHFDSVDSTAWTTGNRFGFVYKFDGKTMKKIDCPKGKRLSDSRKVALINYIEWIKFQKYAEANL